MTLLQLSQKRDEAFQALTSAKGAAAKKAAAAAYAVAEASLQAFKATLSAKTVKHVTKEERYEEEDEEADEDEESDEESDDEPKKPVDSDDDDDDDDDSDDDSDEDEDEEDEDESEEEDEEARASAIASARSVLSSAKSAKNAKAIASARQHLKAVKRACAPKSVGALKSLRAACERITGQKSVRAVIGALDALASTAKSTEKLNADVTKLKAERRREKVDRMLSEARVARKITREEAKSLRAQGLKDPKWLRGHLALKQAVVRGLNEALEGQTNEGKGDAEQQRADALKAQNLTPEQMKIVRTMMAGTNKSIDDFLGEMSKRGVRLNA